MSDARAGGFPERPGFRDRTFVEKERGGEADLVSSMEGVFVDSRQHLWSVRRLALVLVLQATVAELVQGKRLSFLKPTKYMPNSRYR